MRPGPRRRGNRDASSSIIITATSLAVERHRIVSTVAGTAVKKVRSLDDEDIRQGHSDKNLRGERKRDTERRARGA